MNRVLQITAHFYPNVGGVETHLNDLVLALVKRDWRVFVLTYQPLTTKARWKIYENNNFEVLRIPWLAGLFYKLVPFPTFEFLYLLPGLFLFAPFVILFKNPDVIHAHGLVAGVVASFWGKLFGKKVIISTHSIYHFPKKGLYRNFVKLVFNNADCVLGLSRQAAQEIKELGVDNKKVKIFTYWIDLKKFNKVNNAKLQLGLNKKFTTLFVGRLVPEKGIRELIEAAKSWNQNIHLLIIGSGPLEEEIREKIKDRDDIKLIGKVSQDNLPIYYSAADLLIVPSTHEEGFGRVILESLACGTPVIGSNRGAIPEAMNSSVGQLLKISPQNIKLAVESLYNDPIEIKRWGINTRNFATKSFSEKNINQILKFYKS